MRRWGGLVIDRQSREFIIEKVKHYYNLFQFLTPAEVEIDGKRIKTKPNACILSAPMQGSYELDAPEKGCFASD